VAPDAEPDLWRRARLGDAAARRRLIMRHLPLAYAVAARFGDVPPGRDDLRQTAALALVQAVAAYDPTSPARFATFAVPRILGEVRDAMRRASGLGGGRALARRARRLAAARKALSGRLGREPSVAELAQALATDAREVAEWLDTLRTPVALTERVAAADDVAEAVAERLALVRAIADLPADERAVVALRYLGGLGQAIVAARLGVSQSQVSRRERRGLGRIWRALASAGGTLGERRPAQRAPAGSSGAGRTPYARYRRPLATLAAGAGSRFSSGGTKR
jgi:RNA polymerase sigma factor (sigma-70 family)